MNNITNIEFTEKRNLRITLTQTIIWLVLFLLPFVQFMYEPEKWQTANKIILVLQAITTSYMMVIFYVNLSYLAPKYLNIGSNKMYVFVLLLGLVIYIAINYVFLKYYFDQNTTWQADNNSRNDNFRFLPFFIFYILFYYIKIQIRTLLLFFDSRRLSQQT